MGARRPALPLRHFVGSCPVSWTLSKGFQPCVQCKWLRCCCSGHFWGADREVLLLFRISQCQTGQMNTGLLVQKDTSSCPRIYREHVAVQCSTVISVSGPHRAHKYKTSPFPISSSRQQCLPPDLLWFPWNSPQAMSTSVLPDVRSFLSHCSWMCPLLLQFSCFILHSRCSGISCSGGITSSSRVLCSLSHCQAPLSLLTPHLLCSVRVPSCLARGEGGTQMWSISCTLCSTFQNCRKKHTGSQPQHSREQLFSGQ